MRDIWLPPQNENRGPPAWLSRARFFKYWQKPRTGIRMCGKAHFRGDRPNIKPPRDYRPKINRPVRDQ